MTTSPAAAPPGQGHGSDFGGTLPLQMEPVDARIIGEARAQSRIQRFDQIDHDEPPWG